MEEKRVADYFVVAGLPDNPIPLEELSDENILKATHKQDPIVDVAVINRTLGEVPPPKYILVDQTPSSFPADLNHGSIRAPEIYLCFKRGRDKPPITDIGVLYEGKQRVMPGCEVVYQTPYGRPANVNNSNSSRTYITFRRADEAAPSDTLAVTDVCIILSNKGEVPPHAFCLINKNLNKGMVGSDVYLCYKKSMVKANYVAFKPGLLSRYPAEDHENFPLPETVSQFCLPLGAMVECWPIAAKHPRPVFSTFVLTGANGEKVYGAAVIFYEPLPEGCVTPSLLMQLGINEDEEESKSMSIHCSKCISLLSRWPFFDTFKKFLTYLYNVPFSKYPQPVPIERYISHFMTEVPFPSPSRPRILVQFPTAVVSLAMPEESPLPHSGASFTMLLSLGPEDTMNLLLYTLMEHKILIHSLRHAVLTSVAEAVANMIFPFHWQCPYIPLCPLGLSTVLNAPIPFVVGVDSRYFDLYDPPNDVTCVDLDTNTITPADDKKGSTFKWMPKRPVKVLRATLEKLYNEVCMDMSASSDATATTAADNSIDAADSDEALAIDLDFAKHRKELLMETRIQEALLRFMASLLKGYNNFLKPITQAPTQEATGLASLFDTQGFLKSRDKAYHKFYTQLMKTQLFSRFIEERSFVSDKDASLAFFDECTEKVDESRDEPHLIELDDSSKSERTVFITPPDPVGLPPGKEYSYPTFPSVLRPELFLTKERRPPAGPINSLKAPGGGNGGNTQAPPSSPMTRRTKQEVKSAQKIAQKQVASPELWAKCLLGHCYSLWFTHLPSYVRNVHSKTKALRTAYDVLVRMQQAKLQQPDEVCYRVLLQLCGLYSQPVLAVKVLFQMRQHGLQPNAITYGFYNKAVLESKWPTSDTNAFLRWRKMQNVVTAVAQFKQGMKCGHRRYSVYSNSESDYDRVSRASTDSFLEEGGGSQALQHDRTDAGGAGAVHMHSGAGSGGGVMKKPAEHLESPNIEERSSTGGLSDRGYSSMTSEDAKRMSLTIGSQESLESLGGGGGKARPMFIQRETIIKENGPAESTTDQQQQPQEQQPAAAAHSNNNNTNVEMRSGSASSQSAAAASVANDMRLSVSSVTSVATLRASTCSSAGLLMTTDSSLDESVFGGDHVKASKERQRHSSADGSAAKISPSIFRPRRLSSEFKEVTGEDTESKRTTLVAETEEEGEEEDNKRTTLIAETVDDDDMDNNVVEKGSDEGGENGATVLCSSLKETSAAPTSTTTSTTTSAQSSTSQLPIHSSTSPCVSPSHSIRTPVLENDPLGLLGGDTVSKPDTKPVVSGTSVSSSKIQTDSTTGGINPPTQSEDTRSTNDSGIGAERDLAHHKSDNSNSATSSELSSPSSPGWKPVQMSISDHQIHDTKGAATPPTAVKSKSATLPANMPGTPGGKSMGGVMHSAATGFMSRFRQLKETMIPTPTNTPSPGGKPPTSTANTPGATGSSSSLSASAAAAAHYNGSNTSLPKAYEMEKQQLLFEGGDEDVDGNESSPHQQQNPHGPAVEITTFEERVPLGYKNRMKYQLQKTTPFVSDLYKGLLSSPTVKNLQNNLAPTMKYMQSGWSTMRESLAETWTADASFREQEQAYAAQQAERRYQHQQLQQDREKRALDSENFYSYSRSADVAAECPGAGSLRLAARRTYSLKNGSSTGRDGAASGFQQLDDTSTGYVRPRANSLSWSDNNQAGTLGVGDSQDNLDGSAVSSLQGSMSSLQQQQQAGTSTGLGVGGLFNTAVEVEMCSLSRCAACGQLLYDEEIMAGWSADDSNLNTQCQFCQTKLVPFLQVYLKDFRHSSKPVLMTPSQSCESMQSIHSLPNVPLQQQRHHQPQHHHTSQHPTNNRSLTSLNSDTIQHSETITEAPETTTTTTLITIETPTDTSSSRSVNSDNNVDASSTTSDSNIVGVVESDNGNNAETDTSKPSSSGNDDTTSLSCNHSSEDTAHYSPSNPNPSNCNNPSSSSPPSSNDQSTEEGDCNDKTLTAQAEKGEAEESEDKEKTEDENDETIQVVSAEKASPPNNIGDNVMQEQAADDSNITESSKNEACDATMEGDNVVMNEEKSLRVDIKLGAGDDDSVPPSKEASPERKPCEGMPAATAGPPLSHAHRKHKEGSSSMGDLLEESAGTGHHRDNGGRPGMRGVGARSFVCLEPVSVPYLSPLVLRKELETVLDAEGDLCLSVAAFMDEHPILYWNLVWYFKRLGVHSHLPGLMLTASATNKEAPPKLWQKADSRHVHVRAVWDNPRLHEELSTPMYIMWNQAPHQIHPLLREHHIFARGMMQHVVSSIKSNDVTGPIRSVIAERRRLQKATSSLATPPLHYYSMYRDILFLIFAALGHDNIDNDSFDKEYRNAFTYMNYRDQQKCKKQDKPLNHTTMFCRRIFDPLELVLPITE